LKKKGIYWDYGLNDASLVRLTYQLFRKTYHLDGVIDGRFFLRRMNESVVSIVRETFHSEPLVSYSEILFKPDLGLPIGGKENSVLGNLDSKFTGKFFMFRFVARQCSFHVQKVIDEWQTFRANG